MLCSTTFLINFIKYHYVKVGVVGITGINENGKAMPTPQKLKCVVRKVISHGYHVYTIFLVPERKIPKFTAGQFLHLTIDEYEPSGYWPESRVFSIASSPRMRNEVKITYSVKGRYTSRMEKVLYKGMSVWIKMPYGDFLIEDQEEVVLIAGGTGITAFTAFIDQMTAEKNGTVLLAYGAKNAELLIYQSMIEKTASNNNNLKVLYFIESGFGMENKIYNNVITGPISAYEILPFVRNTKDAKYYLSGPPTMIKVMKSQLMDRCISTEQIFIDAWE